MKAPQKHRSAQLSGCSRCQSLALVGQGDRDNTRIRCDQVNDLLCLLADLKEDMKRLRSIRESDREIDGASPYQA